MGSHPGGLLRCGNIAETPSHIYRGCCWGRGLQQDSPLWEIQGSPWASSPWCKKHNLLFMPVTQGQISSLPTLKRPYLFYSCGPLSFDLIFFSFPKSGTFIRIWLGVGPLELMVPHTKYNHPLYGLHFCLGKFFRIKILSMCPLPLLWFSSSGMWIFFAYL